MENKTYRIIVVGPTGSGKSQFCNFVQRDLSNSINKVDESLGSCTKEPFSNIFTRNKTNLEFIDTPGSNDSSNNEIIHLQKLVDYLIKKGEIDYIILLLKFGDKYTNNTREYIDTLAKIFTPTEFFRHLCVIFSHFPIKPKKKDISKKEIFINEIKNILTQSFNMQQNQNIIIPDPKVYFLDTEIDEDEKTYEEKFQETIDILIRQIKLDVKIYGTINTKNLDLTGKSSKIRAEKMKKEIEELKKQNYKEKLIIENEKKKRIELQREIENKNGNLEEIKRKERRLRELLQKEENRIKNLEERKRRDEERIRQLEIEQNNINQEADNKDIVIGVLGGLGSILSLVLFALLSSRK